jgi:hypothetical protein
MLKVLIWDLWSVGLSGLPAGSVWPVCTRGAKWVASRISLAGVHNVVEAVWILEP